MRKINRKAQVTLEAALLIAIVAAGLLAMQGYFRRAVEGSWRNNSNSFSDAQYQEGKSLVSTETSQFHMVNPKIKIIPGGNANIGAQAFDSIGASYSKNWSAEPEKTDDNPDEISGWGRYR